MGDAGRPARGFPSWVYAGGDEPDYRFSLANERTFLAWVRTALALVAGGVALEALGAPLEPRLRLAASLLCLVLGALVPGLAWLSWAQAERAMRHGRPLPRTLLTPLVAAGVCAVAVLVVLGQLRG